MNFPPFILSTVVHLFFLFQFYISFSTSLSFLLSFLGILLVLLSWISFLLTSFDSSSVIKPDWIALDKQFPNLYETYRDAYKSTCLTCGSRPPFANHCQILNKCVFLYDHFCFFAKIRKLYLLHFYL